MVFVKITANFNETFSKTSKVMPFDRSKIFLDKGCGSIVKRENK
jgi:hypothetical protein